jgi:hypothetical protein
MLAADVAQRFGQPAAGAAGQGHGARRATAKGDLRLTGAGLHAGAAGNAVGGARSDLGAEAEGVGGMGTGGKKFKGIAPGDGLGDRISPRTDGTDQRVLPCGFTKRRGSA